MDLNDAERYAVAALFTLALHSTHVESGVDKNGNSLSESDIAWGCPSEELFDEQLLSQVPLKLPPELLEIFWGFDCMAPAGLAPRLYAWLKVPRKAWPGLLRMPDLAGCAGSPEAVEAFVTLVRRYSAFLDPELDFTTGQASRLQQHFSMPAALADAEQEDQQQAAGAAAAAAAPSSASSQAKPFGSGSGQETAPPTRQVSGADKQSKQGAAAAGAATGASGMPASEAVAVAAASLTAAAIAAEADSLEASSRQGSVSGALPAADAEPSTAAAAAAAASSIEADAAASPAATSEAAAAQASVPALDAGPPAAGPRVSSAAVALFDELHAAVDMLPKEADEGTVVPTATFTPAEHYKHTTSHKAVLALYELIGGCLANNTDQDMEPLFATAAQEAETAAFAAAAAKGNKKALQQFMQQQAGSAQPGKDAAAAADAGESRPVAAWFPSSDAADASQSAAAPTTATGVGTGGGASSSKQQQQQQDQLSQQQDVKQQQQVQGLAFIQWYDARARVAVKRVAHWLRVPWPQVRAFEQMWSMQALTLDAATAQPKYESSSRAMQYLKVGAAAVGGGALLAVTGGLAAPAIAAGLGAAVSLAHGSAAVAAAVSGIAGSTAGTAAVTSIFGAWGASVGGGSAGRLYGEVTEFGFWDLSQSIYVDGKGPQQQQEGGDEEAKGAAGGAAARAKDATPAAAAASSAAVAAEVGKGSAAGGTQQQKQAGSADTAAAAAAAKAQQPQPQQQSSFLHRLFSSNPAPTATATSGSGEGAAKSAGTTAAAAATSAAAAAAGLPKPPASPAATLPSNTKGSSPVKQASQQPPLSPGSSQQQQQQQQQQGSGEPLSRKSLLHLFGWRTKSAEEDEGPPLRVRSKAIRLCDDAFNTDSEEGSDEFYEGYLNQQGSGGPTPRGATQQGSRAQTPKGQQGSTTPKQQHQQRHAGSSSPQPQQQEGRGHPLDGPEQQGTQQASQQQQQAQAQPVQELEVVKVVDDPLSSTAAAQSSRTSSSPAASPGGLAPAQQQQQQQRQQGKQWDEAAAAAAGKDAAPQELQPSDRQAEAADIDVAAAAAAAAAAGTAASSAAAAAADTGASGASASSGSAAAAAGGGSMLSGLFSRKAAPPPPVYVPLLPTPVNPKHKDETRMALTVAVNGCCIESMEDFVRPWQHLPSGDCDRFALVWESACLKELGGALTSFLAQQALTQVAQKSIQTFLYTGLVGALALPMTLTTAMKVAFGSKWLVALRRAQAAGKMLAIQLAQGCHGGRPVTLIGCSMGARLVFHCLLELSRLGLRGCVENVILLGAPLSCRPDRWCAARSVVAGRLINGYSVNDWTLGLLYRVHSSSSIWLQAAGMYKVEVPGVENINLSRLVSGHQDYLSAMEDILEAMNMHDT